MAAFPPPPAHTINWVNASEYKFHEVNAHVETTYSKSTGKWTPLRFTRDPHLRIHGMVPALNYGQQALEGLKAFRTPGDEGIAVFRPDRHALRLQHSAEVLSMPLVPSDLFVAACRAAVALNAAYVPPHETGGGLYLRPLLLGTSAVLPPSPAEEYTFCVFVVPAPAGVHDTPRPVRAMVLDEFDRAAPKGIGHAKVGGNYAPALKWSRWAKAQGFGITLHLDSTRHEEVDEFSTCAFIGILSSPAIAGPRADANGAGVNGAGDSNVTLVIPDSPCVIESVTSDAVQHIARSCFGWKVEKRRVLYTELPTFNEVLGAGTGLALVPIRSITRQVTETMERLPAGPRVLADAGSETVTYISDEQEGGGPVFVELLTRLRAVQTGKVADEFGWRFDVQETHGDIDGCD